jgi:hypothetical protein
MRSASATGAPNGITSGTHQNARPRRARGLRRGAAFGIALVLMLAAPAGFADEYDPQQAGHPLRIAAYLLHPVGVALDLLIFRPAHWIVHHEPLAELFGHERYDD